VVHARARRETASPGTEGESNSMSGVRSHLKHSTNTKRGYTNDGDHGATSRISLLADSQLEYRDTTSYKAARE